MNKIAIIGHTASGYREVESLLHQCGMQPARPSRRDGLSPQEISATLCKAHAVPPLEQVVAEEELQQVQAGAVWHGMALDLMLGNLDQPLWGWADPQAVFLLDYWASLDPKLTFVLVYDEPHRVLMEAARAEGQPPSAQGLRQLLDNWVAYNGAMLRFYLRHPGRSLLVHSQQVRRAVDSYLQQLQPLLGMPLQRLASPSATTGEPETPANRPAGIVIAEAGDFTTKITDVVSASGVERARGIELLEARAAELHLAEEILANHATALQLYAELQSAANLPMDAAARPPSNPDVAWEMLIRQRAFMVEILTRVQSEYSRKSSELEQARDELEQLRKRVQELPPAQRLAAPDDKETDELREENELLLSQLHQVQEELERYYLENQRLKQKVSPPKPPGPYGAADRIKRQLSYRLGAVMIEKSRTLGGWLSMPWALVAEARAFREDRARAPQAKLPPIHTYRDAHEAERVKQHLSYRLGSTLLQHGKSPLGWLKLPFALQRQVREFRLQRKRNEK